MNDQLDATCPYAADTSVVLSYIRQMKSEVLRVVTDEGSLFVLQGATLMNT